MAQSNSHKWGQIIGNFIQQLIYDQLLSIAKANNLYLDFQKIRKARGKKKKVSWQDKYGNFHDLDYVLEKDGTEEIIGIPMAFIEIAWRRYTKHSRNKVQEIEGALIPLSDTYSHVQPFLGVVLAGIFTKGSLEQLISKGFKILYLDYDNILLSFSVVGLNANFDENTPESEFQKKISQWYMLSSTDKQKIKEKLKELEKNKISEFLGSLQNSLSRKITGIMITVLHGHSTLITNLTQAIEYVENYKLDVECLPSVSKYEIQIRYSNGDNIQGTFQDRLESVKFLKSFI